MIPEDEGRVPGSPVTIFFSSRRRHTRLVSDWSSDVCSSDLWCPGPPGEGPGRRAEGSSILLCCSSRAQDESKTAPPSKWPQDDPATEHACAGSERPPRVPAGRSPCESQIRPPQRQLTTLRAQERD